MSSRARLGMDPSPNESKVLYTLAHAHSRIGKWGVTLNELVECLRSGPIATDWKPSTPTVRAHLSSLGLKGLVMTSLIPRSRQAWYAPTDRGYLALFHQLHPELSQRQR